MSDASTPQPPPTGDGVPVLPKLLEHIRGIYGCSTRTICADLEARAKIGEAKYGTTLRAHNGRDAVVDAYQEALDLCMYLAQACLEGRDCHLEGRDCHDLLRDALRLALDMVEYREFGG